MATQLYGTVDQQIGQLAAFAADDEVWEHPGTRTFYVGDVGSDDEFVYTGTVAEYQQQLQDLITAR